MKKLPSRSVLFITLDSCRYDTFVRSDTPNLDRVGRLLKAQAPSYFTYGSHASMFVGFTPGNAGQREAVANPKWGKFFRMTQGGIKGPGEEHFLLEGRNIVDGYNRLGYLTLGTGAVGWFDNNTETGKILLQDFQRSYYPGKNWGLELQLAWIDEQLKDTDAPVFLFLNVGETHVPYYFKGAGWNPSDNPCVPFSESNDREKCVHRQAASLEYVDRRLQGLLGAFDGANILVCADHGDCWGEDGLWEHGISHEKTLEVPLLFKYADA